MMLKSESSAGTASAQPSAVEVPRPPLTVVGHRVDAATLAFRVTLEPAFVALLQQRAEVAKKHGAASVHWSELVFGALRFSRTQNVWHITNDPYFQLHIDLCAPGRVEHVNDDGSIRTEPGWTVEIKWYAATLAVRSLQSILDESRAIARVLSEQTPEAPSGFVYEERLRRIDLCADVSGWGIDAADTLALVRRPRAVVRTDPPDLSQAGEVPAEPTLHETRVVTGITVGKDQMMARIYDKSIELQKKPREMDRTAEYERWAAAGWDGVTRVARVEFQIRGEALKAFGARDPAAPVDPETGQVVEGGLPAYIDRLWQSCLHWIRLVSPEKSRGGRPKPISRLPDDPRWALLRGVTFTLDKPPAPVKRKYLRTACSSAQVLGAVLSILAPTGVLTPMSEDVRDYADEPERTLRTTLGGFFKHAGEMVATDLIDRWSSPEEACVHVAIRVNAAIERVLERKEWADGRTGLCAGDACLGPQQGTVGPEARNDGDLVEVDGGRDRDARPPPVETHGSEDHTRSSGHHRLSLVATD
jgi:hypothetical protein